MDTLPVFQDLGTSLVTVLLVEIQREHVDAPFGGIRTFPLVEVFGSVCALLADSDGCRWALYFGAVCSVCQKGTLSAAGLFVVAVLSSLTDMDTITLSIS